MTPILFATDYSPAAQNAGDYAAQLAKACHASLVVLHLWTPPVAVAGREEQVLTEDTLARTQQQAVDAEASRLGKKWRINVKGAQRANFAPAGISEQFNAYNFSLVVVGMAKHGAVGRMLGSVATGNLHKANYPVLIVPEGVHFHPPKTFLLATDLGDKLKGRKMTALKQLVRALDVTLCIVDVKEDANVWTMREERNGIWLDQKLDKIAHAWRFPVDDEPEEAILDEAKHEKAGWVIVAPQRLAWYENLFHHSVSRKLAFTIDRPLLVLPASGME